MTEFFVPATGTIRSMELSQVVSDIADLLLDIRCLPAR
jgi:hypothetical protein